MPDAKRAIYVAEVSVDLQSDRTKIVDQLTGEGYRVVPSSPLPVASAELRAAIGTALAKAALGIHLFSGKRGTIPDDEEKSIPAIQYELASARNLERIVWIPPGIKPHASIDAVLQTGTAQRLERIEGEQTIEDLKEILAAKLKDLDERASAAAGPKLNVYVVCDRPDNPFSDNASDRDHALQLKSYLDSCGYSVWFPPGNVSDQGERNKDHLETLKLSHAVILYWGAAQESWFREALRALREVRSTERRNRPFVAEAIYFSGPPTVQKDQYRNGHLDLVVCQYESFQPAALRPFLDRLRKAQEAVDR